MNWESFVSRLENDSTKRPVVEDVDDRDKLGDGLETVLQKLRDERYFSHMGMEMYMHPRTEQDLQSVLNPFEPFHERQIPKEPDFAHDELRVRLQEMEIHTFHDFPMSRVVLVNPRHVTLVGQPMTDQCGVVVMPDE